GSKKRGLKVWSVGTPVAKSELYRWLKLDRPTDEALAKGEGWPPGFCHFPRYGEEFFKQLTAERLVTRMVKGFPRGVWEKDGGRRNEALDCRVYARAAAAVFGIDRLDERQWKRLEEPLGVPGVTTASPAVKTEPKRKPPPSRDHGDDWLGGRGGDNWLDGR
ncbi:MAG: phage terminase large subunit family protein, partial [Alphaproteobacteria bacterium]